MNTEETKVKISEGTGLAESAINASEAVDKLSDVLNQKTDAQREKEEKINALVKIVTSGITNMYDEIINSHNLNVSDEVVKLTKYHIIMTGNKTFILTDQGNKKVESEVMYSTRRMMQKEYKKDIKSSCKHCHGYGVDGFVSEQNMVIIPRVCRCLSKKKDGEMDNLEILAGMFKPEKEKKKEDLLKEQK